MNQNERGDDRNEVAVLGPKWINLKDADGSVADAARMTLLTRLDAVQRYLPLAALRSDETLEHVHQLRVCTRRVLTAIDLYKDYLPAGQSRWIIQRMKGIRKAAGNARDLDVLVLRYQQGERKRDKKLLRLLKRSRKRSQESILRLHRKLMKNGRLKKRSTKLLDSIRTDRDVCLSEFARSQLQAQASAFFESSQKRSHQIDELHQFRIQAKHLRYTIELLDSVLPGQVRSKIYPVVCRAQDLLGQLNDHSIARDRLKRMSRNERGRKKSNRFWKLARIEKQKMNTAECEFRSWWTPQFADSIESDLKDLLCQPPEQAS